MSKSTQQKLQIFALGGAGEIGKNMYALEYGEDIIVIDAGLKHPEEDMLGIDIVIPEISYLEENQDRVRGILLTHGHEDHIGALPYFLKKIQAPVYATELTLALIKGKLKEFNLLQRTTYQPIHSKSKIKLGCFSVTFFKTTYSIPDTVGICVDTPEGTVVHTGVFKFDHTPLHGESTDLAELARIGEKGVLAVLADSSNAEKPGYSISEKEVGKAIQEQFLKARSRIIVSTFSSNIHSIQNIFDAALQSGRKIAVVGKELMHVMNIALDLGYLRVPEDLLIELDAVDSYADDQIVIMTTGSQGEPMSDLSKMAQASHKEVEISPGDTVLFAAAPKPGNEKLVSRMIDQLYRLGAHVIYGLEGVQVSGHGSQEDLKLMLNFLKPTFFIPVHGEYRMQRHHAKLAENTGVAADHIFLIENGDVVEISQEQARLGNKLPAGNVLIDGLGVGDVGNIVLRDRKLLSQDGVLLVVVTLSKGHHSVMAGPDIISRGFVYVRESEALMDEAVQIINTALDKCLEEGTSDWSVIKTNIRDVLSRFLYDQTRRRPMILPIIMEA